MVAASVDFLSGVNHTRYAGQTAGHYESFFVRANHPTRPLALWIRHTIFSPKDRPADAIGELWAMFFDGETGRHACAKEEYPIDSCRFERKSFDIKVGRATLEAGRAEGAANSGDHSLSWALAFEGSEAPALLLQPGFYERTFPAAKSLVALPMARFLGRMTVDGQAIEIDGWIGSQNHNWGFKHTDLYAWGQVAGFDTHLESFLEVATARLKIGPIWTPPITPLVLRHRGREFTCTGLWQAIRAKGRFDYFHWDFGSSNGEVTISGRIEAPRAAFVGLNYRNPPGGTKVCLNSKIARCDLQIEDHRTGRKEMLRSENKAAFEILTDDRTSHGIPIAA